MAFSLNVIRKIWHSTKHIIAFMDKLYEHILTVVVLRGRAAKGHEKE